MPAMKKATQLKNIHMYLYIKYFFLIVFILIFFIPFRTYFENKEILPNLGRYVLYL